MSTIETNELMDVMDRVKTWSPTLRIALARRILESLDVPPADPSRRGRPVHELIGLGAGDSPPPDDDRVQQWIDEHRLEKCG
jgi:hypothetical protein